MLSAALIGGALADHFDRRRLILCVESALVLCCGVLAWNAWLRSPHLVLVWVGAGLMAGLFAIQRPAMEALMQQLLPVDDVVAAGALNSIRGNFAFIVGPGLAGLIVAKAGASGAFAIDGLSYVVSILTVVMMRTEVRVEQGKGPFSRQVLLEGWRYARRRQDLLGTYLIDMNAVFFGTPNALFPAMAEHTWGTASLGLLYAAPSLGAANGAGFPMDGEGATPWAGDYVGSFAMGLGDCVFRAGGTPVARVDFSGDGGSGGYGERDFSYGGLEPIDFRPRFAGERRP